jgi:plasmid stabilization system protein ParE
MTLRKIQSGILNLNPGERIELYRWLDYEMAADFCSGDCCSRIGVERARQIRREIEDKVQVDARGPGAGRAKLRLSRGFPVGLV